MAIAGVYAFWSGVSVYRKHRPDAAAIEAAKPGEYFAGRFLLQYELFCQELIAADTVYSCDRMSQDKHVGHIEPFGHAVWV